MPLSKLRNKERMKLLRLHKKKQEPVVQPKQTIIVDNQVIDVPELDADVIYDE